VSRLIDTTEMYLRTVYELEEEGIPPLRARLVERLHVSGPAVSETVARLEADGLLRVTPSRVLELSEQGRALATSVMRKHRLAERLLVDVIGLPWGKVHIEACRWEHVISDEVEERLVELLGRPGSDPHGNPIPGLDAGAGTPGGLRSLADAAEAGGRVVVRRISEELQLDEDAMARLDAWGLRPDAVVETAVLSGRVTVQADGAASPQEVDEQVAVHLYVEAADAD
jgi:DtxR family transcriptional regulator, Mn-dependent transcriptional regulator